MNRQAPETALQYGRENRVKSSQKVVDDYLDTVLNIAPIEIDADRDPDTGFEPTPCTHDIGEGL